MIPLWFAVLGLVLLMGRQEFAEILAYLMAKFGGDR
jgi:hypothetical protein